MLLTPAFANTNYVVDGSFESLTRGGGQEGFNTDAADWTTTGYNFLFTPGSADTTGETGSDGNLKLWGPGDGSANGLPATSPDGGNYASADGAFEIAPIKQTLGGLTIGAEYQLAFWWAGAQQSGFTGINTEQWDVSLGGTTQDTAVLTNASHGFTGWQYQTFTFVADSVTPVLSFLAVGTPSGEPPFSLLDGVSLTAIPEPATFALIGLGLIAIPLSRRFRKRP